MSPTDPKQTAGPAFSLTHFPTHPPHHWSPRAPNMSTIYPYFLSFGLLLYPISIDFSILMLRQCSEKENFSLLQMIRGLRQICVGSNPIKRWCHRVAGICKNLFLCKSSPTRTEFSTAVTICCWVMKFTLLCNICWVFILHIMSHV